MSLDKNKPASGEDAQTEPISYTYTTSDASKFLKRFENRNFNVLNDSYWLPSDNEEWIRLNRQHVAYVVALGQLYPAPEVVEAILAPEDGVQKKILDLGCGSGVWLNEMARRFPHADALGLDLAPTPVDPSRLPPNCHFEIGDINHGLNSMHGQFDVVHGRFIVGGIHDYRKTIKDAIQCVKPGGIFLWIDCDYDVFTGYDFKYIPPTSEESEIGLWAPRIGYEVRRTSISAGRSDFDGMVDTVAEGLWDQPLIDPETCKAASIFMPASPWAYSEDPRQTEKLQMAGNLYGEVIEGIATSAVPFLKKIGWPEETLNKWVDLTREELKVDKNEMSIQFRFMWGRRREAPGKPAPPLSKPLTDNAKDKDAKEDVPFPFYFIYHTKEESLRELAKRKAQKEVFAPLPGPPNSANA